MTKKKTKKALTKVNKNSCILFVSDLHCPYMHPDAFAFLKAVKKKHKPTRIICAGDEVDHHYASMHDTDPDLLGGGDELKRSRECLHELQKIFPVMDILESNHGSLYFRRAKKHGLPSGALKSYNELWQVGKGWKWHDDMTITLPNKQQVYMTHGKKKNCLTLSKNMGMSAIQGHYHSQFSIEYWSNPNSLNWAVNSACLIDPKSLAFAYGKLHMDRPIIGVTVITDSFPALVPMKLDKHGRWTNKL